VAGCDQGHLAGQIGRSEVDAGGGSGAGGVLVQQCCRAVVVLDPGLVGQFLNAYRPVPGSWMVGGQDDDISSIPRNLRSLRGS
jgi:hypothetical protein